MSTNQLNETRFRHLHRAYMGSIKQINYAHNLFKDAIVYKMRVLIDQTIADFSKMQEVLKKERNDVRITTQNIFDLLTNMRTVSNRKVKVNFFIATEDNIRTYITTLQKCIIYTYSRVR